MKPRRSMLLAVLALLVVAVSLWLWRKPAPAEPSMAASSAPAVSKPVNAPPLKTAVPPTPQASTPIPLVPNKREQVAQILGALNHKEIEFYGKVVDQYGVPIPSVDVTGSTIYNTGTSSGVQEKHTTTDADGLFSFTGMQGRTFDYHLAKSGYKTMPEGDAFDYTELVPPEKRHHPDPKNPVVLKMWKLQGAEPMAHFERHSFKMAPDGAPLRIDLATGKRVTTGGDLVITLQHPEAGRGQRLEHYPWTAELIAPGGGFVASTARLMYLAPEGGYVEKITLGETGQEAKVYDRAEFFVGGGGAYQQYYVRTGNGCYARVVVDIGTDTNPERGSYVGLTWWLNPKPGSRNLEFDPQKLAASPTR